MSIPSRAKFALPCTVLIGLVGLVLAPRQALAHEAMPLLGEKESAIEAALSEPTVVECAARPLSDVVAFLADRHGIPIQFDAKALANARIDLATPMTHHVFDVKLRSALDLMLRDLGLTTVVLDEVLLITTKSEAETILTTRVYPVTDLLGARDDGVLVSFHTKFGDLMDLITTSIEPNGWDEAGGPGTIRGDRKSASLVVSQTGAVHREIARLFESLRAVGHAQARRDGDEPPVAADGGEIELKVYRLPRILHILPGAAATPAGDPTAAAKPDAPTSAPPRADAQFEELMREQRALLKMIESVIEPKTWLGSGGQGVIWVVNDSALVVRQTRDVHRQIGLLLEAITEADTQRPPGGAS